MARNTNGSGFSLKDELFNQAKVEWLARQFYAADASFDSAGFVNEVMSKLPTLELKARIKHIATVLERYVDADFAVAAMQLKAALPPPLDPNKTDDDFGDFILAPLGQYVVNQGLSPAHLSRSLALLKEITQRFSMEDAIRYFIDTYPQETMAELEVWAHDEHYHVRRLVSEGTRPLLPWSTRISLPEAATIPLLDILHADSTRYVTRSVANHLNDIAKTNPDVVITTLKRWHRLGQQEPTELAWLTRHALRTLIKQGHQDALALLGYQASPKIAVSPVVTDAQIRLGEALAFRFSVTAAHDARLLVDYAVDFVKANGNTKPKVHKLKELTLRSGQTIHIDKKHLFKENATTKTYYPGTHTITIQINGQQYRSADFELLL